MTTHDLKRTTTACYGGRRIADGWPVTVLLVIVFCCSVTGGMAYADDKAVTPPPRNDFIENGPLIQIPGPNPLFSPGAEGAWDSAVVELGEVFKDENTYYMYYHAAARDSAEWSAGHYRLGVASAPHLLGPWKRHGTEPIIDLGSKDTYKALHVACPAVLREGANTYYMWFAGMKEDHGEFGKWDIGLATASHPLGPWKEHEANPILEDFGFLSSVVLVDGKYMMYSLHPIGENSPDSGPIKVATADKPEGPWTKFEGNPVISAGEWGAWDDGGYSEAGVIYHDGVFHCFYGGVKWEKTESIGYAYSFDGYNFTKYSGNPVAPKENDPDSSAFAEVHAFFEPPFMYLFNTQRYYSVPNKEFIGVQILTNQRPFSLSMPALSIESLGAGQTTSMADARRISLATTTRLALTVECSYTDSARKPIRVHVRSSYDGLNFDTVDLYTFDNAIDPGNTSRKTVEFEPTARFIKIQIENPDRAQPVSDLKITASVGG